MNTGKSYRNKISLIISGILLVSVFSLVCCSKPKVYRVGVLCGLNIIAEITDGFKTRMTELGYEEAKKSHMMYSRQTLTYLPIIEFLKNL